ncbi:MAG: EAL domain-containing protein [Betaproteobacteria bacterium]|nr:EAL domain-containing protein [Betaproteobacteria bacterium]
MKLPSILRALDLKTTIAIFTVVLFVATIMTLAHDLKNEVRGNINEVLAAQQFQIVEHVAASLDEAVRLRINALADTASMVNPEWMADPGRLHVFMAEHRPVQRFFDTGIFVISIDGIGLADVPNLAGRDGTSYAESEFFRGVVTSGKPFIGKPAMDPFAKKTVINIAVPIRNDKNEVIGVLAGGNQITGSDLLSEILPSKFPQSGDIHIISAKERMLVASTDPRFLQSGAAAGIDPTYDRYLQGYEGSEIFSDSRGVESLISVKRAPNTGWIVIASLPASTAFKPTDTLQREIYEDAALASVAIAFLLWVFLYRQLSPLSRSAAIIDAMTAGNEPLRPLPLEGSVEIRRLLDSFNKLQEQVQNQKQSLLERAEQMRLAASVFDGTSEAILISSPDNRIVSVNRAFCAMTGYDQTELIGRNPKLLKSGRHDRAFYQEMWSSLNNVGQWHGEIWNRRKSGEIYPERITISVLYDEDRKVLRYIAIAADITEQKEAEAVIWRQANYDLLTNLPNRRLLQERVRQALEKARQSDMSVAVLHVDLDHFNEVNDTLGQVCGDKMIIEAGARISSCVEEGTDTVAHLGGDEFAVVLSVPSASLPRIEQIASEILRGIAQPFSIGRETVYISASIGITVYPNDAVDMAGLLVNASQAKQLAKNEGRNQYCHFTESMRETAQARMQLTNEMRGALAANQFEVYYQPIVNLATGQTVKAEALLRWRHPVRGLVSPSEFIPIAEEAGMISEIGDWVFKEVALMASRWCRRCRFSVNGNCDKAETSEADSPCQYQISVNKSPRQFFTGHTDKVWIEYLHQHNIRSSCIVIEITEGLLLDRHPEVMEKLDAFRDIGIQVALDDFGTGYSAMSYLKKFDIDYLKIDQSFVRDIVTDPSDRAIAEAVIAMAHKLGMKVVAEGVETIEQRNLLADAGCDYGQGYYFAKPMPAAQFERLIVRPATQ